MKWHWLFVVLPKELVEPTLINLAEELDIKICVSRDVKDVSGLRFDGSEQKIAKLATHLMALQSLMPALENVFKAYYSPPPLRKTIG